MSFGLQCALRFGARSLFHRQRGGCRTAFGQVCGIHVPPTLNGAGEDNVHFLRRNAALTDGKADRILCRRLRNAQNTKQQTVYK